MSQSSYSRRSSKKSKQLPENFFETLLVKEMNLKNSFSIDNLQEVIALYTVS
jgi:hypothetical protein